MSNPSINEEDLKNFCSVTGATIERARFYVEAANGDLGVSFRLRPSFHFKRSIPARDMKIIIL